MPTQKDNYAIEEIPYVEVSKPIREGQIDDKEVTDSKIREVSFSKIKNGSATNKALSLISSTISFVSSILSMLNSTLAMINSKITMKDDASATYSTDIEEKGDGLNMDLANAIVISNKLGAGYVLIPKTDNTFDIGVGSKRFKDIYSSGNVIIQGKNAVRSGNNADGSWTINFTTNPGGTDNHTHTASITFFTTTMIKDATEYYVFKHT